ncbi:MAG: 2Fe-2S iron-sulfur cluster-binding protein [Woeseiaceae bacterium]
MAQLKYKEDLFTVSAGDTVLDTLLANNHEIPNNCRAGACQSCLMQVTKGQVPSKSQKGLKDSHKVKGLFLACSCVPEEDIEIELPNNEQLRTTATVSAITPLSNDVIELKIITKTPFEYVAGQYVTLWKDEKLGRSYSIANSPTSDHELNFHIQLIANGQFTT